MPTHNPDCTHGGPHAYTDCRDRYNAPLKMVADPEPVPHDADPATGDPGHPDPVGMVVETGDEALKLLLAAAGNVVAAESHPDQ